MQHGATIRSWPVRVTLKNPLDRHASQSLEAIKNATVKLYCKLNMDGYGLLKKPGKSHEIPINPYPKNPKPKVIQISIFSAAPLKDFACPGSCGVGFWWSTDGQNITGGMRMAQMGAILRWQNCHSYINKEKWPQFVLQTWLFRAFQLPEDPTLLHQRICKWDSSERDISAWNTPPTKGQEAT